LADIGRKSAYALFAPTLSASYSWGKAWLSGHDKFMGADFPDANATSSKLSLTATIPLFAGGARVAAVKAAGIEQEKANIVLNQKQRDIEAEFIELRLRFAVTQEKLQSARTIEEMALRAASLAQSSYTNGVATLLSLSEAQDKLAAARLGLANALYECRCVYYDWLLATGQE
jgi:outer membrane protein TolC